MKGLLIKDFYAIFKQMKAFLLLIAAFAFIPGMSSLSFAIIFATLLPITTIAYDERSKWNRLAAMMPYSAGDLVLSKYLFGYIVIFATTALCCFAQAVVGIFTDTALTGEFFMELVLLICAGLIIDAVELPVIMKLGVEKGRMFMIFFVIILAIGGTVFASDLAEFFSDKNFNMMPVLLLSILAAAVLNALSVPLSVRLFRGDK